LAGPEQDGIEQSMRVIKIAPIAVSCARSWSFLLILFALAVSSRAQTCLTSEDMDTATRSALQNTAQQYFDLAAKGDVATLRQNAIPSVATDFGGIEAAVRDHQETFAGAHASPRAPFLLTAEGAKPLERAEFLCGVFGKSGQTANSAVFVLPNLPPGEYAVVILDVAGQTSSTLSFVLQKLARSWRLGGFYARPSQVAGHDGPWFLQHAREFKAKGQNRNAWLYYMAARELLAPVPFMSTLTTDRLYDESQTVRPADLPEGGNTADLVVGGKTYKLTSAFAVGVGNDLDLVVKYSATDISNTNQTYQQNVNFIRALTTKFPELREGFTAIIARAVEASGRDYGTMLAVKDIK
jgi:hypothetical protein